MELIISATICEYIMSVCHFSDVNPTPRNVLYDAVTHIRAACVRYDVASS